MKKRFSKNDLSSLDQKFKLHLINSISGHKAANLIGTKNGTENLAIISSVFHLGTNPPLVGFIMRPHTVRRDTYDNIKATGYYTINHINTGIYKNAHYTSAKFEADESEFEKVNLPAEYKNDFPAPFVLESKVQIGLKFVEEYEIPSNGCILMIGEIQELFIDEIGITKEGKLNFNVLETVSITGLNQYHKSIQIDDLPYARLSELPNFYEHEKKQRGDNVVYDEEKQTYTQSIKQYGTDVSAPAIEQTDMSVWKNVGSNKVNHHLKNKFQKLKGEYEKMLEIFKWNELIYSSKFDFEPIIGETYHLYERSNGTNFLSQIQPNEWKQKHVGSFKLDEERVFRSITTTEEIQPI